MIVACNDVEAIRVLRPLLADRNPGLRRYVAAQFVEFARREELKPVVLEESMAMLADTPWRGIEQATQVLGTLDHKPAASRLLELLPHDRPEVMATAAWALRRLRIPETLPAALKRALLVADKHLSGPPHFHEQLSQLQQMFGDLRYREAEPLLRRFIPKSQLPNNVRMSACWSLGLLYENQPDNDLVKLFVERLTDVNSSPSESVLVRQMTAVGLGRMQAKSELPVLRKMAAIDSSNGTAGAASYWAIEQMTGEKPPVAQAPVVGVSGWFLEPTVD
jgi:HEAT repeat protein